MLKDKFMTRQQYNKKILNELSKLIDKYPNQRFGQLIANYILPSYRYYDIFYEESQKTFENIGWITNDNYEYEENSR